MKRFVIMAVLALMLLFVLSGDAFCGNDRFDFFAIEDPDGDDHPWGGDDDGGGLDGTTHFDADNVGFFTTSIPVFDLSMFFSSLILTKYQTVSVKENLTEERYQSIIESREYSKRASKIRYYKQR